MDNAPITDQRRALSQMHYWLEVYWHKAGDDQLARAAQWAAIATALAAEQKP